jgi:hypothetical protein
MILPISVLGRCGFTVPRRRFADRTYAPGEVITESTDVDPWVENKGSEPVALISVDLFKE